MYPIAMRRRLWYHVTPKDHGPLLTAVRRPPLLRTASEPMTPRVCVSSSIAGCLSAVLMPDGPAYIYAARRRAVRPVGVWDAAVTGERWLVPPVSLKLYRVIPANVIRDVYAATNLRLERRKKSPSWKVRIAQLVIASRITDSDREIAELWYERYIAPADPEDFILLS